MQQDGRVWVLLGTRPVRQHDQQGVWNAAGGGGAGYWVVGAGGVGPEWACGCEAPLPCPHVRPSHTPHPPASLALQHHIYMTRDGRLSLAGLSKAKCAYLAAAVDDSVRNH